MDIKATVRILRKNQTSAEKLLWLKLRNKQFLNLKFVRQYPIIFDYGSKKHFYVADFYCHNLKLVLELDGEIHQFQKERDKFRDYVVNSLGFVILRFNNEEIFNNLSSVLKKIANSA